MSGRRVPKAISRNGANVSFMTTQPHELKRRSNAGRPRRGYDVRRIAMNVPTELAERALAPYESGEVATISERLTRLLAIGLEHEHEHSDGAPLQLSLKTTK